MQLVLTERQHTEQSWAVYYQWALPSGESVESSVLYIGGRGIPHVVCLPNTIGCRMGCTFCAVQRAEFIRPIDAGALWQILHFSLQEMGYPAQFQVSFMGQGEPFDNAENLERFCVHLHTVFPSAIVGLSTVGVASGMLRLLEQPWATKVKLQLSVHAVPAGKRREIIPAEEHFPLEQALPAARRFAEMCGKPCCLSCVLLNGVNDDAEDAEQLAAVAKSGAFYVKISRLNPHSSCPYAPSPPEREAAFCAALRSHGVDVHIFQSIGTAIKVGCGQTRLPSHCAQQCDISLGLAARSE